MRKESSCRDFDVYKDGKGYKSIYDNDWMIEHVQKNLAGLRVDVKFTFCLTCTCKITDKAKFRPDAKKVSVAVVESTKDCLGNFTAILPDETTLNQWIKPQFVEMDTEKSLRKMATFRGESPESMAVVSSIKATLQMMSRSITDLETQLDAISEDFNHSTKSIAETSSAETKSILTRDVKTKIILAMQDEKEEQERALEQIEDCDEETRSW
ncbi:hypothetical protein EIK77_000180 [Talaromyces pinophilus]|nr:hypothetical protein EIK77_000180 [Talaromyces pinophilus]